MNYCRECENRQPTEKHGDLDEWLCPSEKCWTFDTHPACAVFSEKKRTPFEEKRLTCGECIEAYWGKREPISGRCWIATEERRANVAWRDHVDEWAPVAIDSKACDNFNGEATRKTCGGTAERGM